MVTEKLIRKCIEECNEVLGLEPQISVSETPATLLKTINLLLHNKDGNGNEFIQPDDEFSEDIQNLLDEIKNMPENELQSLYTTFEENTDISSEPYGDTLEEQVNNAVKLRQLKDICNVNQEFKSLRGTLSGHSDFGILQDKMIEILTNIKLDEHLEKEKEESGLKINSAFKESCPKLTEQEYKDLEKLILKDKKIIQPIITWKGFIVDGHNRYELALKHNIPFETEEKEFANEKEVIIWIKENAISQRNLPDFVRFELVKEIRTILGEEGKKAQAHGKTAPGKTLKQEDKRPKKNTRKELARETGLSEAQVGKALAVDKIADKKTKEDLRQGKTTIGKVHKEIVKKEKKTLSDKERLLIASKELDKWTTKYSDDDLFDEYTQEVTDISVRMKEALPF